MIIDGCFSDKDLMQYNGATSAAELVQHVKQHGINTDTDSIVRAQDILGRSTIEELLDLANSLSTRDTFYFIAFKIWHWEQATQFYNQHSNPMTQEHADLKRQLATITEINEQRGKDYDACQDRLNEQLVRARERHEKNIALETKLQQTEMRVLELKAKLYDMMTSK